MNSGLGRPSKRACFVLICSALTVGLALFSALSPAMADSSPFFSAKSVKVALDPGHGGRDGGARGPTGLYEKTVCLELARKLALQIETQYLVTLIRSDDYHVELVQRAAIANQAGADLLISLHTGAGYIHSSRGISIYYHRSRNIPAHELQNAGNREKQPRWDRTQSRHRSASLALASALKKHLAQLPGAPACNIHAAPLPLLEGADMPAVLIEIGHITHPNTEAKLAASQYQDRLSAQIHQGIQDFLSNRDQPQPDSRITP